MAAHREKVSTPRKVLYWRSPVGYAVIAAFDEKDEQIPELQKQQPSHARRVLDAADEKTEWWNGEPSSREAFAAFFGETVEREEQPA